MKDNKLEVGDIVFRWHGTFDSYLQKYKVVRLTPKRAILKDGTQVDNNLTNGWQKEELEAKIIGEGSYAHVTLSSPEMESKYKEQGIRRKAKEVLNNIKVKEISIEQCEALINIFPIKKP